MKNRCFQKCRYGLAASIAIFLFNPPVFAIDPPCVTPSSRLVSWWAGQGNALDSADGNHGTPAGNVTFGPGRVGQGFVFDGSSDAVVVGAATNLQLQDFSIEAWIKRTDPSVATFGTHTTALFFSYGSLGYGFGIWDDGRLFLTRVDIDNVSSDVSITDTNFHHVAVTKSGTTVVFYIDGVPHPAPAYGTAFTFSTVAAIGARADTMNDTFFGTIDEVAVYSRVLSPTEILSIYNADSAGKCRNPIAPFILFQPKDQTVYIGDTTIINLGVNGDRPLTYQWRFNSADLAGQTKASLQVANAQTNNAGVYSVFITNTAGSILSSNAVLTVNPKPPCTPTPAGLVSWWRAENDSTDGWDSNNGQSSFGVTFLDGKVGRAFNFASGSTQVPDSPSLRFTKALTIEAWVKPSSLAGATPRTILSKFEYPLSQTLVNQSSYFLGTTNNGSVLFMLSASGSARTNTALVTPQLLPTNQWSFVVATYDGSVMNIFINGNLAAQTNYSGNIFPGFNNLALG